MEEPDLLHLTLPGYILGSRFYRQNLQKGGAVYFRSYTVYLYFSKINISRNCKEKDFKICAVKVETKSSKLIILSLYRVPTGHFNQFIKNLDDTLKHLYKPEAELLICGDINTDYLIDSNQKNN
jgi:exonuclease III